MARLREVALVVIAAASAACHDEITARRAAVIYGADDRIEAVDATDERLRSRVLASVVAIVRDPTRMRPCDPVEWNAPALGEFAELCEGEPFADQPVIAGCSGTLIDENLVVTARHCFGAEDACATVRIVTGLYNEPDGRLRTVARNDVYACRRLFDSPEGRDIVIVELDRPVAAPFAPMPVASTRAAIGDRLHVAGFPTGIPMKLASDCSVLDYYDAADEFRMNCDLFAGNSGSGVLSESAELLGVYSLGAGDYRPRPGADCFERQMLAEDGTGVGVVPQLGSYEPVDAIVAALCSTRYPSPLCRRSPGCGDGVCSGAETFASCDADCAAPACSNGTCELGEDFDCPADCGMHARCDSLPDASAPRPDASTGARDASPAPDAGPAMGAEPDGSGCRVSRAPAATGVVLLVAAIIRRRLRHTRARCRRP